MEVTVEKIDDINFIFSGTIENTVITKKALQLKEEALKDQKSETLSDEIMQQNAAGEVFKDFISNGMQKANISEEDLLGQPALKKYEKSVQTVYFEVEISTNPTVNVNIDYKEIAPEFTEPTVSSQEVEEKLLELSKKQTSEKFDVIIDDAFAKKALNDETATLVILKTKLVKQITSEKLSQNYIDELKSKIIEALLLKIDFSLPNNLIEQEIDTKVRETTKSYTQEQQQSFIDNKGKFMELRESFRQEARDNIKIALIVEALALKEGITVHDQEVHTALSYQAMLTGENLHELFKYYKENNLLDSIKMGLTEDKVFGVILGFNK